MTIPRKLSLEQWMAVHQRMAATQDELFVLDQRWERWMWIDSPQTPTRTLHLEDVSGIPFVNDVPGVEEYQHRARVRAGDGDLFASVTPAAPGYERYCQEVLGLGAPELIVAEPTAVLTQVAAACAHGAAFERLVQVAKDSKGLCIHPYMAIESVWALAAQLEQAAEVPVKVLGPTPQALWIANDKANLDKLVRMLGLEPLLVETVISTDDEVLAKAVRELAARHSHVGIKRTRCASAMGNEVIDAQVIRAQDEAQTLEHVRRFMAKKECEPGEEVLAVQWVQTELSPSTQLWIPELAQGSPRLDGVYEQLLVGPEKVFLGSRPATIPESVQAVMAQVSLRVATAFQALGYVGRCSFDFIVEGDVQGHDWRVYLTECNGRWGGTSTPMQLVDRLVQGPRPHYIAQDVMHEALVGRPLEALIELLGPELFDPKTQQGRYILYNVGPLEKKGKLDVITLGSSPEDALAGVREVLPRLWGLG